MVDTKLENLEFREKVLLAISKTKKSKEKKRPTNNKDLDSSFTNTFAIDFFLCTS